MGDEAGDEGVPIPGGPRSAQVGDTNLPFILMEDILDKLKLLNYELHFCRKHNYKPLTRTYFALQASKAQEQFSIFNELVAWLFKMTKHDMNYDQFDDPNSIVSKIINECKKASIPVDYPPTKLKQGYGEAVTVVLNSLLDHVMKNRHVTLRKPVHPPDNYEDEVNVDDDAEVGAEGIVDTAIDDGPGDEDYFDTRKEEREDQEEKQMIEATVDPAEWKEELERVTPQLKLFISSESKDWRNHIEQISNDQKTISQKLPDTKTQLERIAQEVGDSIEKIENRERRFNDQCSMLVEDYRNQHRQFEDVSARYRNASETISNLSNELSGLTESLDSVKAQMEEKGSSMTDTSMLVNVKTSLQKLKQEVRQMELRIGVLAQTLMGLRMKDRNVKDFNGPEDGLSMDRFDNGFDSD